MYTKSLYLGLYIVTVGPKYLLFGWRDPDTLNLPYTYALLVALSNPDGILQGTLTGSLEVYGSFRR